MLTPGIFSTQDGVTVLVSPAIFWTILFLANVIANVIWHCDVLGRCCCLRWNNPNKRNNRGSDYNNSCPHPQQQQQQQQNKMGTQPIQDPPDWSTREGTTSRAQLCDYHQGATSQWICLTDRESMPTAREREGGRAPRGNQTNPQENTAAQTQYHSRGSQSHRRAKKR